jgi:ketosteroid isomerase-like protein
MPAQTTPTAESEILQFEQRFWQAIQNKDVEAAVGLTEFPCIVAGASGIGLVDREAFKGMMAGATYTLNRFDIEKGAKVRLVTDDIALVAYKVREQLTVDGKPVTLDAADASVWVRRDGRWRCALHTESVSGDAYGRDRKGKTS